MIRQKFLTEIESARLMLHQSGYKSIDYICNAIQNGTFVPETVKHIIVSNKGETYSFSDSADSSSNPFDAWQQDSVAIIPLTGLMLKERYWWEHGAGMDDIAAVIRQAYESANISSVIIKFDTPGGNTDSIFLLQEVLSKKIKPTFGYVDGMCASCGYIVASYLDKIYSINKMARIGGVGVFARMLIPNDKDSYYKVVEAYPEESKDKNLPERELAAGNDTPMKEQLSKLAVYFQDLVTDNRPKIPAEALTGKIYYSYEAEKLSMIDGVRTLSEVITEITKLVESRKQILFNL